MLQRIVKLTLKDDSSMEEFKQIYALRNPHKNGVEGCHDVQIMRDAEDEGVYYTVSLWENKSALDAYRNSAYFSETWPMVKQQLSKRAEAFSMVTI